jgi:hypothetical protein
MLVISIAAFSLAFAPFAIPSESVSLLTRYYMGIFLGMFAIFIRVLDVAESSRQIKRKKQDKDEAMARIAFLRTSTVNLLFMFPMTMWVVVYVQSVQPKIGIFVLIYCIVPIILALCLSLFEYKSLHV